MGATPREEASAEKPNDEEFDAISELEEMLEYVARIDAIVSAAINCFEGLPRGEAPEHRKAHSRLYGLVSTAAEVAELAHEEGRARVERLAERWRRLKTEPDASARAGTSKAPAVNELARVGRQRGDNSKPRSRAALAHDARAAADRAK